MSVPALELSALRHTFFPGTPSEQRALQGVDLVVEQGEFIVILGINGSGKSTLLNVVAGTLTPDTGTVTLAGRDVTSWPDFRRAAFMGRVFQDPFSGSARTLTIAENLAVAATRGRTRGVIRTALGPSRRRELHTRLADLGLGLETMLDTPMGALSGGQRQVITLLMATMLQPDVLLLDEHTSALDPKSTEQVVRLSNEIVRREKLTTLMVTHSLHQAVHLGDLVIIMHRGRIVERIGGARKRQLRVEDLSASFDRIRNADLVDESASEMLRRMYV